MIIIDNRFLMSLGFMQYRPAVDHPADCSRGDACPDSDDRSQPRSRLGWP